MKTRRVINLLAMSLLMTGWTSVFAQNDRIEVPGDHFSLEGALELFKKSSSPEEFEQLINSSKSQVNNLDLNGDGDIDYIKVIDRNEGNVHAFILQAIISSSEVQDVAVIELEKLANGKAVLQITGDADIYGIETIIEPTEEVRVNAGTSTSRTVVNVWAWPSVQYVYSPYYYGWSSPWNWNYRPIWWHTWRPVTYYNYYSYWQPYRPYYSVCYTHRVGYAQRIYQPYRSTSMMVYNRHHDQLSNYRSSPRYTSDYNRGRDNDGRTHTSSNNNTHDAHHSLTSDRTNSRSSSNNNGWRQQNNDTRSGSSTTRDRSNSSSGNSEATRSSNSSNSIWRNDTGSKQRETNQGTTRQQNVQSFENRGASKDQRSSSTFSRDNNVRQSTSSDRGQSFGSATTGSRQHEFRPTSETRSVQQHSVVQPDRGRSSSGNNSSVKQSGTQGSHNSGNKSSGQKRGRD